MSSDEILKELSMRSNGDIYLGIVGPVRVGKSTFIKKFMENAIIQYISDEKDRIRTIDELPQSGEGRLIMTTEPKFVPNNAVNIKLDGGLNAKVRLVDCVGYIIPDAKGYLDENGIRKVLTPWFEEAIPFNEAARIGTQKVINEHATIGIVVTTDGSITDIPRESYIAAENEVINELLNIGKPFIIIVNTKNCDSDECKKTVDTLKNQYDVPVIPLVVSNLTKENAHQILRSALYEFNVSEINIKLPAWIKELNENHYLRQSIENSIAESSNLVVKLKDVEEINEVILRNEYIKKSDIANIDCGSGIVEIEIETNDDLYREILKEIMGIELTDQAQLLNIAQDYANIKKEYGNFRSALKMLNQTGYGYSIPNMNEIKVSKPELIKNQNRYGVKVVCVAKTIHLLRVDVETSFEPIIGSKEQSEELIKYLTRDLNNPSIIFESDIFGRKLGDLIIEGVNSKLYTLNDTAKIKLQDILTKLVNKGKGNVIAIVL